MGNGFQRPYHQSAIPHHQVRHPPFLFLGPVSESQSPAISGLDSSHPSSLIPVHRAAVSEPQHHSPSATESAGEITSREPTRAPIWI